MTDEELLLRALKALLGSNNGFTCDDYTDRIEWDIAAWAIRQGLVTKWSAHTGHLSCRLTDKGREAMNEIPQLERKVYVICAARTNGVEIILADWILAEKIPDLYPDEAAVLAAWHAQTELMKAKYVPWEVTALYRPSGTGYGLSSRRLVVGGA